MYAWLTVEEYGYDTPQNAIKQHHSHFIVDLLSFWWIPF